MSETKIRQYKVDYGNGLIEQVKCSIPAKTPLKKFRSVDKTHKVNIETGEVIETRIPKNKAECESTPITMINEGKKMLYNATPFIDVGEVFFITGCFEGGCNTSKPEFEKGLNSYLKSLRDMCKRRNPNSPMKYVTVKEHGRLNGFHTHGFIWHENRNNPLFTAEELENKWKYGEFKLERIDSKEELLKAMFYCFNYRINSNSDFSQDKVLEKREGLVYFSSYEHLYKQSNNLLEPQKQDIKELNESYKKLCETHREFGKDSFYDSTFFDEEVEL